MFSCVSLFIIIIDHYYYSRSNLKLIETALTDDYFFLDFFRFFKEMRSKYILHVLCIILAARICLKNSSFSVKVFISAISRSFLNLAYNSRCITN